MRLEFRHTYAALPPKFYARVQPTRVASPQLVVFNRRLAEDLGLDADVVEPAAAALFSGNELPEDADPIAMAYAGHQFGNFVPRLGDGRAILLGELMDRNGVLRDVQLKGAGLTPFSRAADGRAALGPMLREYLISEAMHALGIPTTRSLAVVATGERVVREDLLPGAVLTRVAAGHVRVGTFEYFAARRDLEALRELVGYVMQRHYPEAREADIPALAVLRAVADRQAALIAEWMRVGFIHGVMNTDNMALSGETIDYGPCAFMDRYQSGTVFSSIDRNGRYAYANQPGIAQWNLARFAETLLPLISADTDEAVALATEVLEWFMRRFDERFVDVMRCKMGLVSAEDDDVALIQRLLSAMQNGAADFTLTFRRLAHAAEDSAADTSLHELFADAAEISQWLADWRERAARDPQDGRSRAEGMRRANPLFIPRNHRVEAALSAASEQSDLAPFNELLDVLRSPYEEQPGAAEYASPPEPSERVFKTFCGT